LMYGLLVSLVGGSGVVWGMHNNGDSADMFGVGGIVVLGDNVVHEGDTYSNVSSNKTFSTSPRTSSSVSLKSSSGSEDELLSNKNKERIKELEEELGKKNSVIKELELEKNNNSNLLREKEKTETELVRQMGELELENKKIETLSNKLKSTKIVMNATDSKQYNYMNIQNPDFYDPNLHNDNLELIKTRWVKDRERAEKVAEEKKELEIKLQENEKSLKQVREQKNEFEAAILGLTNERKNLERENELLKQEKSNAVDAIGVVQKEFSQNALERATLLQSLQNCISLMNMGKVTEDDLRKNLVKFINNSAVSLEKEKNVLEKKNKDLVEKNNASEIFAAIVRAGGDLDETTKKFLKDQLLLEKNDFTNIYSAQINKWKRLTSQKSKDGAQEKVATEVLTEKDQKDSKNGDDVTRWEKVTAFAKTYPKACIGAGVFTTFVAILAYLLKDHSWDEIVAAIKSPISGSGAVNA
jgi:hypothetical protein